MSFGTNTRARRLSTSPLLDSLSQPLSRLWGNCYVSTNLHGNTPVIHLNSYLYVSSNHLIDHYLVNIRHHIWSQLHTLFKISRVHRYDRRFSSRSLEDSSRSETRELLLPGCSSSKSASIWKHYKKMHKYTNKDIHIIRRVFWHLSTKHNEFNVEVRSLQLIAVQS